MIKSLLLVFLLIGLTAAAGIAANQQSILFLYNAKFLPDDVQPVYTFDHFALAFAANVSPGEATPIFADIEGDYFLLRIIKGNEVGDLLNGVPHIFLPDGGMLFKADNETAQKFGVKGWGLTRLNPAIKPSQEQYGDSPPVATVVDSNIVEIVSSITSQTCRQLISELSAFPTRYSFSQACRQAEQYALDKFTALGLDPSFYSFTYAGTQMRNVIGQKLGETSPESIIIVCAHLDCTSESPESIAPGAEDNASGCAAVFEAARVIEQYPTALTIRFITFSGEEQGLIGSDAYASYVQNRGEIIKAVINIDMIGYSGPYSQDMHIFSDPRSFGLGALGANIISSYTSLDTIPHYESYPRSGSDHYPFAVRGYPAIFFIDAWDGFDWYPYYHSTIDTTGNLNMPQQAAITRAVAAMAATLARPRFGPSYFPGDANGSGDVNGIDVVFLVNYLKGGQAPDPILRGDCNGDCLANGLDVVYLVNFLKGLGGPPFSGQCD